MDQTTPTSKGGRLLRLGALATAVVLLAIGASSVVKGLDGRATVRDALKQEKVVGTPTFTPAAIAAKVKEAGLTAITLPTCSVAGKKITGGANARCFAEYMRVDALMATGGKTYAEMPRFATKDGKGTNDAALALPMPNGQPMNNPARQVWVTQTALATALNTSYMAEQISLFGTVVGIALLLVGLALAAFGISGLRAAKTADAHVTEPRRAAVLSGA